MAWRKGGGGSGRVDARAGLPSLVARLESATGFRVQREQLLIKPDESFIAWCERLGREGMKVDGKPFSLDDRPALRPLYEAIPTTRDEAKGKVLVVMKATQLGMTIWEVLAQIYMAAKWEPVNIGMFLPDQATASFKSEHRFMRIVRSVPEILKQLTQRRLDPNGDPVKVGEGNILTRTMGESIFMFLWTSGKVTTESRPMDIVSLDEVQEMTLDQIDKVMARLGDSEIAFALLLSTANMPDLDIDYWYRLGNQEVWHTRCEACGELSDLSDPQGVFPTKSIAFNTGQVPDAPMDEYVWTCPHCKAYIADPQNGEMVEKNPGASSAIRSMMYPRTVSPRQTARKTAEGWARAKTGDQKKSFFNRTLARPYIDPEQIPVTLVHCNNCVALGKQIGLQWKTGGHGTVMGIDQMGSFNAVIIKERLPDGRQAVIHVEAVFDIDPFVRCTELMKQFGVAVCVVEQLPNVNDARKFANLPAHKGRVFLAGYANLRDDAMIWGDQLTLSDRKTADEERSRYMVTLHQYKCMQTALYRIRDGLCLFPDPAANVQRVIENGVEKLIPILQDWVFLHFTKTAIVVQQIDDNERKLRPKVLKVGLDPHYSFANMLCDVAWARSWGTAIIHIPDGPTDAEKLQEHAVSMNMPGAPPEVVRALMDRGVKPATCGACFAFPIGANGELAKRGPCGQRGFDVASADPCCPIFVARR